MVLVDMAAVVCTIVWPDEVSISAIWRPARCRISQRSVVLEYPRINRTPVFGAAEGVR